MRLAAGSLPWLVWQDLRIAFRSWTLGRKQLWPYLLYGAFLIGLHAVAGLVLYALMKAPAEMTEERVLQFSGVMLLSLEFFMLMAAMIGSFRLILAGRELSLHLSSPLPFERVLWMRVVALIATTWAISILLVTPVANMGALLGEPVFLLAYPVTVMMAMLTLALALSIMAAVVRGVGIVRARRVLQVVQALVPLAFVAISLLSRDPEAAKAGGAGQGIGGSGLVAHVHLVRLPALALTGDVAALMSLAALASLSLLLATRFAAQPILLAVQSPDQAPPPVRSRASWCARPIIEVPAVRSLPSNRPAPSSGTRATPPTAPTPSPASAPSPSPYGSRSSVPATRSPPIARPTPRARLALGRKSALPLHSLRSYPPPTSASPPPTPPPTP